MKGNDTKHSGGLNKYLVLVLVGIGFLISLFFTPQKDSRRQAVETQITQASAATAVSGTDTVPVSSQPEASDEGITGSTAAASQEMQAQPETSGVYGDAITSPTEKQREELAEAESTVKEDGEYTSMTEVAAYIHLYGRLPSNFISKTKAKNQGWIQSEGNLQDVLPGKSIGGSRFYNDEGVLPEKDGRTYTECDIDYQGGKRGAKRIVYSDDGLVFYTEDHYETFIQLY